MFAKVLAAVVWVGVAVLLLIAAWPQLFGLQRAFGVVQAVSLRGVVLLVVLGVAVLLGIVTWLWRRGRTFIGGLLVIAVAFAALQGVVILSRGVGGSLPVANKDSITVLEWNTAGGAPGPAAIASLIEQEDPDIVSLPETNATTAKAIVAELSADGFAMQRFTFAYDEVYDWKSTTLLVAKRFGTYTMTSDAPTTSSMPSVIAKPKDGDGPQILAVHLESPREDDIGDWRSDLDWIAQQCAPAADQPDLILVGDFNSTIDHWGGLSAPADGEPATSIGRCADAAAANGAAAVGTWPASAAPFLGSPIDHVLTTQEWRATGFEVIQSVDAAGSDHRPIVARLQKVDTLLPTG